MKKNVLLILILGCQLVASGQDTDSTKISVWDRLYFNWFDVGVITHNSDQLNTALIFRSSVEYRFQLNSGPFVRFSSDNYSPVYRLEVTNNETNIIEGDLRVQEWLLGPGYRIGEQRFRGTLSFLSGIRQFNFPLYNVQDNVIRILEKRKFQLATSVVLSGEFYITNNTSINLNGFYNHTFKREFFWENGQSGAGIAIGLTSSF